MVRDTMKGKKIVPQMLAGFVMTIGAWIAHTVYAIVIPAEVAVAMAGIVATVISMFTPDEMESE